MQGTRKNNWPSSMALLAVNYLTDTLMKKIQPIVFENAGFLGKCQAAFVRWLKVKSVYQICNAMIFSWELITVKLSPDGFVAWHLDSRNRGTIFGRNRVFTKWVLLKMYFLTISLCQVPVLRNKHKINQSIRNLRAQNHRLWPGLKKLSQYLPEEKQSCALFPVSSKNYDARIAQRWLIAKFRLLTKRMKKRC